MFLVLLLFWFVFNGRITLEIFLVGAVVSAVLTYFWHRVFRKNHAAVIPSPKKVWAYTRYVANLVVEIFRCNFQVMYLVLHPKEEVHPQLLTFKTRLKEDHHKTILANSITLTPGTITVGLQGDTIRVHGLDASMLEGIENSEMVRQLEAMEEEKNG